MCRRLKGCCPNLSLANQTPKEEVRINLNPGSPDLLVYLYDLNDDMSVQSYVAGMTAAQMFTDPQIASEFLTKWIVYVSTVVALKLVATTQPVQVLQAALSRLGNQPVSYGRSLIWRDFLVHGVNVVVDVTGQMGLHVPAEYTVPATSQGADQPTTEVENGN